MVWAGMDEMKISLQDVQDEDAQNPFYNGWYHGHYVNCTFLFAPDGTIPACVLN